MLLQLLYQQCFIRPFVAIQDDLTGSQRKTLAFLLKPSEFPFHQKKVS